jgi:hypothetical protein
MKLQVVSSLEMHGQSLSDRRTDEFDKLYILLKTNHEKDVYKDLTKLVFMHESTCFTNCFFFLSQSLP